MEEEEEAAGEDGGGLPFTGYTALAVALLGVFLAAVGLGLRRRMSSA